MLSPTAAVTHADLILSNFLFQLSLPLSMQKLQVPKQQLKSIPSAYIQKNVIFSLMLTISN
jgi:hypothetical protein